MRTERVPKMKIFAIVCDQEIVSLTSWATTPDFVAVLEQHE
jgi:hypothetical protein